MSPVGIFLWNINRMNFPVILIFNREFQRAVFQYPVTEILFFDAAFDIVTAGHEYFSVIAIFEGFYSFHEVCGTPYGYALDGGLRSGVMQANIADWLPLLTKSVI